MMKAADPVTRRKFRDLADIFAMGLVASIPWSTSITYVFIGLWLATLLPTIEPKEWREVMRHPAAYLTAAFVAVATIGMLWADVSWRARSNELVSFLKLLAIPALFIQFRQSPRAHWVLLAFLASCTALLIVSWFMALTGFSFSARRGFGVPVRDYISQAQEFILCALGLVYLAYLRVKERRWGVVSVCVILALLFVTNALFIAPSRTALVTLPILAAVLVAMNCRWSHTLAFACVLAVATAAVWFSSTKVRDRVLAIGTELQDAATKNMTTSSGLRLEFWKTSLVIIKQAPLVGHGTGSLPETFRRVAVESGSTKAPTKNPHNQTLTIVIQLGLIGGAFLFAMWAAHFLLFRNGGLAGWIGLAVVTQNILGCLFNNHLFDFTQSWIYIFGVGVAGALVLKSRETAATPALSPVSART